LRGREANDEFLLALSSLSLSAFLRKREKDMVAKVGGRGD
jgi:hypothetical protein